MNIKRLLLYPIVVALGISLVSGLIPTTSVNAAVTLDTETARATSYSYYQAVYSCFNKSRVERDIETSKAGSPGDWVNDFWANNNNGDLKTGFLVNDNGKSGCKDILTKALQFWQVDGKTFLQGVGYGLSSDGTKYTISDGNAQQNGFKSYISSIVGSTATLNNKIQYELDIAALTKGCKDQNVGKLSSVDESTRRQAQSKVNDYYTVLFAEQDTSTNYYVFKKGDRPGSAIENYSSPPDIGGNPGGTADCVEVIAANITKASGAIAKQRAQDLYNTYSNQLYSSLSSLIKADCPANQNAAIRTECEAGWKDTFNKCFANIPTTLPIQNGADGDPAIFQKADKTRLNTLAVCIAKGTASDAKVIADALAGASNQFAVPVNTPVTPEDKSDKTSCAVDGVGWIICPVVTFLGGITDQAYTILSTFLLNVPASNLNTADPGNGLYRAWEVMRNIANVAFVIAFLIIIFSQLSSVGVSNYGIKKLLPRLIVAAILVNVSYYICAAAVDASNILGNSLKGMLDNIANSITSPVGDGFNKGNLFGTVIATIITSGTIYLLGLSVLLPVLITALAAVVTVVAVLVLRQALIILLIVVAPLAFVAYLLPNTEDLFTKWRKLLTTLLVMYPLIALIFGGSALAAKIVMTAGAGAGGGNAAMLTQIAGAGIAIIPLFITPVVMRTAGGVLNRFGGMVNNPNKGPFDRMRKGAANVRKREQNRMNNGAMNNGGRFNPRRAFLRRNARLEAIDQNQQREFNRTSADYIADQAQGNERFMKSMTAGSSSGAEGRASGAAANIKAKLEAEEVTAANAIIKSLNLNQQEARQLANGSAVMRNGKQIADSSQDLALRTAARQQVVNSNDVKGINDLVDNSSTWGEKDRVSLADTLAAASGRPSYIGQGALAKMRDGKTTGAAKMMSAQEMIEGAIRDNVYSPAKIATADKDELNVVANTANTSAALSTADKQKLINNAHTALSDPELARTITKNIENVQHIRGHTTPPPLA